MARTHEGSVYYTRKEVEKILGLSRSGAIHLLERSSTKFTRIDLVTRTECHYLASEIEAYAQTYVRKGVSSTHRSREGDVAAIVFSCFEKGLSITQIVKEYKLSPKEVTDLWEWYGRELDDAPPLSLQEQTFRESLALEHRKLDMKQARIDLAKRKLSMINAQKQIKELSKEDES